MYYSAARTTTEEDPAVEGKMNRALRTKGGKKYANVLTQDISESGIRMLSDGLSPACLRLPCRN